MTIYDSVTDLPIPNTSWPFVYKGYFPLFKQDVDASSYGKGNGSAKQITINNVIYYMPNGLNNNEEFNGTNGNNPFVYQTALDVGYDPDELYIYFNDDTVNADSYSDMTDIFSNSRDHVKLVIIFGTNVQSITNRTFQSHLEIYEIFFEDSGNEFIINEYAFSRCENIQSVYLPNNSYIDGYAFEGCSNMSSIYIPASVKYLGVGCFGGASSLETVFFEPRSFVNILAMSNGYIFHGCGQGTIEGTSIYNIDTVRFDNWGNMLIQNRNYDRSNGYNYFPAYMFYNSSKLKTIGSIGKKGQYIAYDTNVISYYTFASLRDSTASKDLYNIVTPGSLNDIHNDAFVYNTALKTVILTSNLKGYKKASIGSTIYISSGVLTIKHLQNAIV